jgi:type IV secretion system protein VirB4
VRITQKAMAKLGLVVVREDLRFEECYWAQMPGNFPFRARHGAADTYHLAGFCNLQTQPMGNAGGSPWGPAISLLSTVQETPYFFNFHREHNAHTLILGNRRHSPSPLAHFLVAQARKTGVRIVAIDMHGNSNAITEAMGGAYLTPGTAELKLNPLHLPSTAANQEFLALWLSTLLDPHAKQLTRSTLDFFKSLITAAMAMPPESRRISALLPQLREADPLLADGFAIWCAGHTRGELFDMPTDNFALSTLTTINVSRYANDPATRIPLVSYLLHRITLQLDGKPTLILLDDGLLQLDTPLFAPRLAVWLDHLTQKNAAVIATIHDAQAACAMPLTPLFSQHTASNFVQPGCHLSVDEAEIFGLNADDHAAANYMTRDEHHVLLKRGKDATLLRLNLDALGPLLATLEGKISPPHTISREAVA